MTEYEFLENIVEYIERVHNVKIDYLHFPAKWSRDGKPRHELSCKIAGGRIGHVIPIGDEDRDRFERRVYGIVNEMIKYTYDRV